MTELHLASATRVRKGMLSATYHGKSKIDEVPKREP